MNSWPSKSKIDSKGIKQTQFFQTIKNLNESLDSFEELYLFRLKNNAKNKKTPFIPSSSDELKSTHCIPIPIEEKIRTNIKKMQELQSKMDFIVSELFDLNRRRRAR